MKPQNILPKSAADQVIVSNFYHSDDVLVILDPAGIILAINQSASTFFETKGFYPKVGQRITDAFVSGHRKLVKKKIESTKQFQKVEFELFFPESKESWAGILTFQEDEALGDRIQFVLVNTTKTKSLENVFRKLTYMAAFTKNLITLSDTNLNLTFANKAFLELTEYSLDEIIGKDVAVILKGKKTNKKVLKFIDAQLEKGKPYRIEILDYKKSGESFWQDLEVVPLKDDDGVVIGYMSIGRDITEQKEKDEKIVNLLNDLKSLSVKSKKQKQKTKVKLTKREKEVLSLIKLGFNNTKIGYNLGISIRTAEKHRQNIFNKYQVNNTVELLLLDN